MNYYRYLTLVNFVKRAFMKLGASEELALEAACILLEANVCGIESHGLWRLSDYVRLWEAKRCNLGASLEVIRERKAVAVVDAHKNLGLMSAPFAMRLAMQKARDVGCAWVGVRNSNHFGIAGYHASIALKANMIGIAMTNASPLVAPTYGKERLLGTNPIAIAIPSNEYAPFVIDMSTTVAANGKIERLRQNNIAVPQGWMQNKAGNPTQDPTAMQQGGALLPLGGDQLHASYKGYCLSAWIDIFSGILSGACYGPWVPPFVQYLKPQYTKNIGQGIGHMFCAIDINAFRPLKAFKKHMSQWIKRFQNSEPIHPKQNVLVPGQKEYQCKQQRLKKGIPIDQATQTRLRTIAEQLNLNPPKPKQNKAKQK